MFSRTKLQLIIVENSSSFLRRLTDLLSESRDIEVIGSAADPVRAIAIIRDRKPQAVLVDVFLDNGSGLEVLQAVQDVESQPHVLVMTNQPSEFLRKRCMRLGALAFFDKASDFDEITDTLSGIARLLL